ncbi:MAG TPA: LytR C-terminal domain-containing protein [Actinomycetota bacterium]|nr:LytR C-terminal domain-containing protein [Actinomycetota bacterium]
MNLGIARLAIIAALVVGGIAVLANGFSDQGVNAAPPRSPSPSASQSPSPSPPPQQNVVANKKGVLVQVFNGTSTAGLAGDFELLLEDEGYLKAGEPADAPDKPIIDSIVYFRADDHRAQNRADAKLLAKDYLGGAPVAPLPASYDDPAITSESADVIVVMGEDQAGV